MIGEKWRGLLKLDNLEDGAVCLILIIPCNAQEATANLLGPIIMNSESRIGMQLLLVNPDYSSRHLIFRESSKPAASKESNNAGA